MIKAEGNRKRKCKNCGDKIPACDGFIAGVSFVCNAGCAYELAMKALEKSTAKQKAKARQSQALEQKKANKKQRERRKATVKIIDWQRRLRKLVQQYVRTVRDKGANCCTCGNPEATEGGHYISVGSNMDLQFEETNIHPQCHECNCYNSGRRSEYNDFILMKYGQEHFDWLNGPHPSLKEKFPHWSDYEAEIKRYRKILRDNGVTPCV